MPALHAKPQPVQRFHLEYFAVAAWVLFLAGGMITAEAASLTAERVVSLANAARLESGLPALTVNQALTRAAELKAADMASKQYFAHTSPTGVSPWHWFDEAGYAYRYAGENLAIHFTRAEDQQQAWMDSEKHRANILNPKYRETGVAVAVYEEQGSKSLVTVQLFGTLMDTAPAPAAAAPAVPQVAPAMTEIPASRPASETAAADPISARDVSGVFAWSDDTALRLALITFVALAAFGLLAALERLFLRRVPVRSH